MWIIPKQFADRSSMTPSAPVRTGRVLMRLLLASGVAAVLHDPMLRAAPPARGTPERERLARAIKEAGEAIAKDGPHAGKGALVYLIPSTDDVPRGVHSEIHNSYPQGGYKPGNAHEGDAVIEYGGDSVVRELRLQMPGRELFSRSFRFRHGEVIVWDDVVLPVLTARAAGKIEGNLWLEGDPSLAGIRVSAGDRDSGVETDEDGWFAFDAVRKGKVRVSAHKPGYWGLWAEPTVEPGRTATVELDGYLIRQVLVHWAYISDEAREFDGPNVKEGTAIVNPTHEGLNRVSFAAGFERVNARSDFLILQKAGTLQIVNTDQSGPNGPGIVRVPGMKFDELKLVPKVAFSQQPQPLERGDLFLLRCFDGKHYAKMEILDVFTGDTPAEAMRRLMKGR